jgi:hypothetical protein
MGLAMKISIWFRHLHLLQHSISSLKSKLKILSQKFQSVLQPIIDLINEGKDFDEIKKSILEANKDLDTTELEAFLFAVISTTLTEESVNA